MFGIGKLVLSSNDPEAASAFYARAGGLSFERAEGTRRYESISPDGAAFVIDEALEPLPTGRRECALSLRVEDLEATTARLREGGIEVGPIVERAGGRLAALKDPDGRDVELWETRSPVIAEPPPLLEKPALIEAKPEGLEPPPPAEAKPDAIESPSLIEAKPDAIEPPPFVQAKLEGIEPPSPVERSPESVEPPPLIEAKPEVIEPPALVVQVPKPLVDAADEDAGAAAGAKDEATKDDVRRAEVPAPPPMMGAPGPVITAVRPGVASVHGGTKISLYGANFADGCRALVDGDDTTSPNLVDDCVMEIEAPPHKAGPVDVVIENPDGKRGAIQIVYDEGPTIVRFSPLEGPPHGGTEILVEGRNFHEDCRVTFFGGRAPDVVFLGPDRLRFTSPPQEEIIFHGQVRVTNPDGLSTVAEELFTYRLPTPEILGMSPSTGLVAGGKRISVKGVDFHPKCVARLGGAAASVTWKSPEALDLATPRVAEPGAVDLEIENPDGQIAKLEAAFTYEAPPTPPLLVDVQPARGYCEGGLLVRLFGDNFEEDTIVRVGEVRAVARTLSRREIEIELPPRKEAGQVAVELTDRHGVVVRREDIFTYEARPAPRIDEITPRNGPMVGGTRVLIEGDYFDEHVYVRVGGQKPKYAVVRSKTTIELVSPPSRAAGLVDVEVGRGEAGLTVAKKAFCYDPSPAPVISSIAPNKGGVDGGTEVSIEGKGFIAESAVLFGRTRAEKVKFVSATTLEVKAPPGKDGEMADITVRNPDGKEAVSKRAFMYDARYR